MKNLKDILVEGLADWDEGDFEKSIKKETSKTAIKKEIIDWIDKNTMYKLVKSKLKFDTSTMPWVVDYPDFIRIKMTASSLTNGLFQWGTIDGTFCCDMCTNLESLEGAPKKVMHFSCCSCHRLTSLEGGPEEVKFDFVCNNCKNLKSLKGGPEKVRFFRCTNCTNLESLEGCPEIVNGFYCNNCKSLKSLKGIGKLNRHVNIDLEDCENLESIKDLKCESIQSLWLINCKNLKSIECDLNEVEAMNCSGCQSLKNLKGGPKSVNGLYLNDCINLKSLEGLPQNVFKLEMINCKKLEDIDALKGFKKSNININTGSNIELQAKINEMIK